MAETYDVTGTQVATAFDSNGRATPMRTWTFTTKPHNLEGTVSLPDAAYTVDQVREALEAEAAKLEAVHTL